MAMISEHTDVVSAGVLAAELLAIACGSGNGLQAETVRNLAEDLGRGLRSPSDTGPAGRGGGGGGTKPPPPPAPGRGGGPPRRPPAAGSRRCSARSRKRGRGPR